MRLLRRFVLGLLLLAAMAFTAVYLIWPDEGLEIVCLVFVVVALTTHVVKAADAGMTPAQLAAAVLSLLLGGG